MREPGELPQAATPPSSHRPAGRPIRSAGPTPTSSASSGSATQESGTQYSVKRAPVYAMIPNATPAVAKTAVSYETRCRRRSAAAPMNSQSPSTRKWTRR